MKIHSLPQFVFLSFCSGITLLILSGLVPLLARSLGSPRPLLCRESISDISRR